MTAHPQNSSVDPGCDQPKRRIREIGTIEARDGLIHVWHWSFGTHITWIPPGTTISEEIIDNRLGGWEMCELHDIAHGYPCHCGVDELLRDNGLPASFPRRMFT